MRWSRFSGAHYGYMRIRNHLPPRLRESTDGVLLSKTLSDYQIDKLENLGKSIGMKRSEIVEATNLPIDHINPGRGGRTPLIGVFVCIIILACVSIAVALLMSNPQLFGTTPTYTYAPGTRYGSISPNDFKK
jgi:hypothetical protein